MKALSKIAAGVSPSATLAVSALAKKMKAEGKDVIGFGAGMLADYLINNSLLPFLVTCLAAFLLTAFCQMFRLWIFHGASFWRLLAMALGQSVFSLPLAVPYYYISRAFHRRRALR